MHLQHNKKLGENMKKLGIQIQKYGLSIAEWNESDVYTPDVIVEEKDLLSYLKKYFIGNTHCPSVSVLNAVNDVKKIIIDLEIDEKEIEIIKNNALKEITKMTVGTQIRVEYELVWLLDFLELDNENIHVDERVGGYALSVLEALVDPKHDHLEEVMDTIILKLKKNIKNERITKIRSNCAKLISFNCEHDLKQELGNLEDKENIKNWSYDYEEIK